MNNDKVQDFVPFQDIGCRRNDVCKDSAITICLYKCVKRPFI